MRILNSSLFLFQATKESGVKTVLYAEETLQKKSESKRDTPWFEGHPPDERFHECLYYVIVIFHQYSYMQFTTRISTIR